MIHVEDFCLVQQSVQKSEIMIKDWLQRLTGGNRLTEQLKEEKQNCILYVPPCVFIIKGIVQNRYFTHLPLLEAQVTFSNFWKFGGASINSVDSCQCSRFCSCWTGGCSVRRRCINNIYLRGCGWKCGFVKDGILLTFAYFTAIWKMECCDTKSQH